LAVQHPDDPHPGLLRLRSQRPNCRRAAHEDDELASPHAISPRHNRETVSIRNHIMGRAANLRCFSLQDAAAMH
jgi:hypothetical protein